MAGCCDRLPFLWGGGEPHQGLVSVIGGGGMETIGGRQTRTSSVYHGYCGRAGGCNSPHRLLLPSLCSFRILCLCLFRFVCVRVKHDSFLSLPRATRGLGAFVVLGDDLFDECITKGGHQIGHHLWFGALSQEGHVRYCGFLGKK